MLMMIFTIQTAMSELEGDGTGIVNGYRIGPGVDLKEADLRGADLRGANLEGADLRDADLEGADLGMASLVGCNLDGVNLSGAILSGVRLSDSNVAAAIAGACRSTKLRVIDLEKRIEDHSLNIGLLLDDGQNREVRLSNVEQAVDEHELNIGLLLDDGQNREVRLSNVEQAVDEHELNIGLLLDDGQNREFRITDLETNREAKDQEIESLKDDVKAMRDQLQMLAEEVPALQAAVVERDKRIALLEERPTLEQIMDARGSTVIQRVEDDRGGRVTLNLRIEQSEDLAHWVPLDEVLTYSLPVTEGKKFYRFALAR
jgi:chromosome segregation ATPase